MVDALTKWAHQLTAAAPKSREMRELVRQHDTWLRTAELGRPYWGPGAYYEWQGPEHNPQLTCTQYAVFNDRSRDRLYTPTGTDSLALWHQWGAITTSEPAMPPRPRGVRINGELRDYAHPERWDIKQVQY